MRDRKNPNRQDTILGGMILGGFVVIAVIAALFTLASWRGERTADVPKDCGFIRSCVDSGCAGGTFRKLVVRNTFAGSAYLRCAPSCVRNSPALLASSLRASFRTPSSSGLIESPMPIGAVWIPVRSRPFYNRLANRLAIRVCLDEETLVALLNNFDADWLLRHPRERTELMSQL